MCDLFLKLSRDDEAEYLAKKHPNAFILLFFIAKRARRYDGHPDGLTIGQCHIGDHENMGLSRQEYRTALALLETKRFLQIVENCRTRQKSTTGSTTVGTLVKLCDSRIYDINPDKGNHRPNHRPTTDQPPTNHEQERTRKNKKEEEEEKIARTAARPHSKSAISFDFESFEFLGISDKDKNDWKTMYPHIDVAVETLKAANWLKSNPAKSRKKNWLKYLTGWFNRGNDTTENKKAYRSAASNSTQDRRTKGIDGKPISSTTEGKF